MDYVHQLLFTFSVCQTLKWIHVFKFSCCHFHFGPKKSPNHQSEIEVNHFSNEIKLLHSSFMVDDENEIRKSRFDLKFFGVYSFPHANDGLNLKYKKKKKSRTLHRTHSPTKSPANAQHQLNVLRYNLWRKKFYSILRFSFFYSQFSFSFGLFFVFFKVDSSTFQCFVFCFVLTAKKTFKPFNTFVVFSQTVELKHIHSVQKKIQNKKVHITYRISCNKKLLISRYILFWFRTNLMKLP